MHGWNPGVNAVGKNKVKQILKEQGLLDNKKYASVLNDIQDKK